MTSQDHHRLLEEHHDDMRERQELHIENERLRAKNALMRMALGRIAASNLHDMHTLHPDGCARLAREVLEKIGEQAA